MNVQADLQALRKLYGLLQNSHVQESTTDILDDRAKLVLKNLLDDATEKALDTHTKMIAAAQSDCYSQEQQFNMASKFVSPFSPDGKNIKSSQRGGTEDLGKYSKKLPSNTNKSCWDCEQRGMKQQHIRSTTTATSKLVNGTQRQQQYVKKLKTNQGVRGKRINEIKGSNLVSAAASASSSNSVKPGLYSRYNLCGQKKSGNVTSDFSRDVDYAIRRIESGILDLHDDMGNAVVNPNPKPIQLAAGGQISKRLMGSKQAQAQAMGLRLPLPVHQKETMKKNKKQPALFVANNAAAAVCVGHKIKPPPRRQAILRPTLIERNCSESLRDLAESDETSISIGTSSSWETNTSDSYSDNCRPKSYPKKFAYRRCKSSESSSDSSSRVTSNSSTGSRIQTSNKYRLYDHKAVSNSPEEHTAIGRLRRFKNKLGFIFHHHHHHHHHHHYSKVSRHTNNEPDILLRKHRNKSICVKQAAIVDKCSGKSRETSIMQHNKQQQQQEKANHFRKLVKGLMRRHVRQHSKKQNNGRRNLQWWQKFKRNGGVTLGNRRARLGLRPKSLQRIRTIKMK